MLKITPAIVALLAVFIPIQSAQASLLHNVSVTPDSAYLEYASMFPEAGWLGTVDNGVTSFGGNITLITPSWGITAAHVLLQDDGDPNSFYEGYRAGFTDDFFADPGENQFAAEWVIHPDYQDIGVGPDLALVRFENAFSIDPAVLYEGDINIGDELTSPGFGDGGTVATGPQPIDGKKRAIVNEITSIDNPSGYIGAEFRPPSSDGFQELGGLLRFGNSGSSGFHEVNDGFELSAVASYANIFPGYFSDSFWTYLSADDRIWVNATTAQTAVPEPSSMLLLGLGSLLLMGRRRKSTQVFGQ